MIGSIRFIALCVTIAGAFVKHSPAWAHPHVFVDGKAEFIFWANKQITAIRNIWRFDEGYSAFATVGLDENGDGKLSRRE